MGKVYCRLTASLFAAAVVFGCGGGGGKLESADSPDVSAYESWLQSTLSEQKDLVQESTAQFVDLGPTGSSDILTNIVGWIRVDGDSSIDQLKRWSNSPDGVAPLLGASIDTIAKVGRSFELKGSFKKDSTVGLNIPLLSAVLNFSKTQNVSGGFTVSIAYESSKTYWIGRTAMEGLLREGNFKDDFRAKVLDGKVKIYQGLVALHNVKIVLHRTSTAGGGFTVGNTFKDPKTGITFGIAGSGSGTTEGTVTLSAADDLFVGVSQRALGASDLGVLMTSGRGEIAGKEFAYQSVIDPQSGKGSFWVRNESLSPISRLQIVPVAFSGSSLTPTTVRMLTKIEWELLAKEQRTQSVDFGTSEEGFVLSRPALLSRSWADSPTAGNLRSGIYTGTLEDMNGPGGGLNPRRSVAGFVEDTGKCVFFEPDGRILFTGTLASSGDFALSGPGLFEPAEGHVYDQGSLAVLELGRYRLSCQLPGSLSTL